MKNFTWGAGVENLKSVVDGILYYIAYFFGVLLLMLFLFVCMVNWFFNPFESTSNIIDDVLYYAWNVEKFGFSASLLRIFIIASVVNTIAMLAYAIIKQIKRKGESLKIAR